LPPSATLGLCTFSDASLVQAEIEIARTGSPTGETRRALAMAIFRTAILGIVAGSGRRRNGKEFHRRSENPEAI